MKIIFVLSFFLLTLFAHANRPKSVKIAISHFPPFVDKEHKDLGLFPHYIRAFLESNNISSEFIFLPYSRALDYLKKDNQIDLFLVGQTSLNGLNSNNKIMRSHKFFSTENCAYYSTEKFRQGPNINKIIQLRTFRIVSLVKNPVNQLMDHHKIKYKNITNVESTIKMILSNRADLLINSKTIIDFYLKKLNLEDKVKCSYVLHREDVILATSHPEKHAMLLKKFNEYILKTPLNKQ